MPSPNKRTIVIIAVCLGISLVVGLIILAVQANRQPTVTSPDTASHYDANSGQTISDPAGKAPEDYSTVPGQPLFLGSAKFLEFGVSASQLTALSVAFTRYSQSLAKPVQQVSFSQNSFVVVARDRNSSSTVNTINFNAIIDSKTPIKATFEYSDLTIGRLYLYDAQTNKQFYDSQPIDGANQGG